MKKTAKSTDTGFQATIASQRKKAPSHPPMVRVFDPQEARRKLSELLGDRSLRPHADIEADGIEPNLDLIERREEPTIHLSHEDTRRHRMLSRLAEDADGGLRPALVATQPQFEALGQLIEEAPHFATPLNIILSSIVLSRQRQTPLTVPPMLFLGSAGLGKTWVAKQLAELLGSSFHLFAMNAAPSMFMLAGLATSWRGAGPGRIANMLVEGDSASPVCVFDEIDKAITLNATDRPYDLLHSIFERENSSRFIDDFYDVGFNCSNMITIATANNVDHLPASLLDRLLILRIEMPSIEHRRRLAARIFDAATRRLGLEQMLPIDNDALAALAALSPRRMTRVLSLALPAVYASGQESVTVHDIRHTTRLLDKWQSGDDFPIGFLAN